jgi:hypothetical protein
MTGEVSRGGNPVQDFIRGRVSGSPALLPSYPSPLPEVRTFDEHCHPTHNPEEGGIDLSLLAHISPLEWSNVMLYGEYKLNREFVRRSFLSVHGRRKRGDTLILLIFKGMKARGRTIKLGKTLLVTRNKINGSFCTASK